MKKIKFLAACVSLLLIISCSTDNVESNTNFDIKSSSRSNFEQISDIDNILDQITVASALSPDDKRQLWQDKLDNYISNNKLNSSQADFLYQLKVELNDAGIFEKDNEKRIKFIHDRTPEIQSKGAELLGVNESLYLFTRVENPNQRVDRLTGGGGSGTINPGTISACDCEDYNGCVRIVSVSLTSISWEYGDCNDGGCFVDTYFFGFVESDNTGSCKYDDGEK